MTSTTPPSADELYTALEAFQKEIDVETRSCRSCVHIKVLFEGFMCRKTMKAVNPKECITYKVSEGTCFVQNPFAK